MLTPEQVIGEARGWLGVPFLHQGRNRNGIDCIGLPIVVGQSLGILPKNFEITNYGRMPSEELLARIVGYCRRMDSPVPGALVVIAWERVASHIAFCTGSSLIHAYERRGMVIEHGYRGRWLRITHSVWAFPEVVYE